MWRVGFGDFDLAARKGMGTSDIGIETLRGSARTGLFFSAGVPDGGSCAWLLRYVVKFVALLGVSHHWSNWLVKAGVFMRLAIPNGQLSPKSLPCVLPW